MGEGRVAQKGTLRELQEQPATSFVSEFVSAQRSIALA
jgi:ABC-type proline/glycine betaine transport system ATPase subunit